MRGRCERINQNFALHGFYAIIERTSQNTKGLLVAGNSEIGGIGFGLLASTLYGSGDFIGGIVGKRAPTLSVVITSQAVGFLPLLIAAILFGQPIPPTFDLVGGLLMGLVGAGGLLALYSSLATGRMSVVAPVSAVVAAVVPVIYALLIRLPIRDSQWIGVVLALVAVWFVSRTDNSAIHLRDIGLPVVAGLSFALFYIISSRVTTISYLWPLVAARLASITAFIVIATVRREPRLVPRSILALCGLGGILDTGANVAYVLSLQIGGQIAISSVLSSLYPATTILLARFILHEKVNRTQLCGIVAALVSIVLITI